MSQTLGSLPIGAKVKDANTKFLGEPIVWLKADKDHTDYPTNSTTLITEKIIALRAFDAKEPNNTDSDRQSYGNNKYSVSNIDQWLNSDAAAGQWYTAKHEADQAPTTISTHVSANTYTEDAGFLNGFSNELKSKLLDTTLKVALNTVTDGGSYESITRKVFLASRAETFGAAENSVMEGSLLSIFSENTNACRIAYVTQYSRIVRSVRSNGALNNYGDARSGAYGVRPLCNLSSDILVSDTVDEDGCYTIDFNPQAPENITVETPVYCNPDYNTGGVEGGKAKISWSSAGNCKIYKLERSINGGEFYEIYIGDNLAYEDVITDNINTIQYRVAGISGTTSSDYTISSIVVVQDNYPPFISGDNTAFGDVATRIKYNYTVYDGDDVNVTVKEYVNTTLIKTYTATGSANNVFEIDLETWNGLSTGDNYIKIEVEDDDGSTATQTKHFNKIGGVIEFVYEPFGSSISAVPKAINVKLDLKMPLDASIEVLATNNANDTQPVWDDITTAALSGTNHIFSNTAKQQGVTYYNVKIKVKINRNGADGEIKLYGMKCQLDCSLT